MTKQTYSQKGSSLLIILSIVAIVIAGALILSSRGKLATKPLSEGPVISNSADLTSASNSLDQTDMTQFNTDLNQLNADASAF